MVHREDNLSSAYFSLAMFLYYILILTAMYISRCSISFNSVTSALSCNYTISHGQWGNASQIFRHQDLLKALTNL